MYVSFREKFLKEQADGSRQTSEQLFKTAVLDYLTNAQSVEGKLKGIDLGQLTLRETEESHVAFTVNDQKD